jgi:hypothetical protein
LLVARPMRLASLVLILSVGCVGDGKPAEEELDLIDDGKDDSLRRPTDHGEIAFATATPSALTEVERHHAWTFELSGAADVELVTSYAVLGQRRTDTVLYLYKEGPTGWGSYIARNDDYADTVYSKITRSLGPGRYRAIVKGYLASTRGKFSLTAGCSGDGCTKGNPCLFGATYGDIEGNPALQEINSTVITAANLDTLNAADQGRLVIAVQQSSHTDVTTPLEALSRVDQGEINVTWLLEPAARRAYIAFEYGAGDNSYGAIFDRHSAQLVTAIHDGDLERCIVKAETCVLPEDWNALKMSTAFATESSRAITSADQLTGVAVDQAMQSLGQSYDDLVDLADGLSRVDDKVLNVVALKHKATGVRLEVFQYAAGDTVVGRVYYRATTNPAGNINDLSIEACTFFE